MKIKTIIGKEPKEEVTIKEYPSGTKVVGTGDVKTFVKGAGEPKIHKVKVNKSDKEELLAKPDKFKISKGQLVRKGKKQ